MPNRSSWPTGRRSIARHRVRCRIMLPPVLVASLTCWAQNRGIQRQCGLTRGGCLGEQLVQRNQCRKFDNRIGGDPDGDARGPVKHPGRQLQPPLTRCDIPGTAQKDPAYLLDRFMHLHDAAGPGMPAIKNLALFCDLGPVGVTTPRCTTPSARIRALAGRRRWPLRHSGTVRVRNGPVRSRNLRASRPGPLPRASKQPSISSRL
jgi:hypothetical protein